MPTPKRSDDDRYMARCLELAERYRGRTSPNPIVGCVIVRGGKILAEGVHRGPGKKHGEADALGKLGGKAPGATLYCNLEPCTHFGRTPPCMPAVRDSGVTRVVIGSEDPVPGHGGGMRALKRAGIVIGRALVDACDRANRPFLTWARYGRAAFTLKAGVTLDGKIATAFGESQWITSEASRTDVMRQRDRHDAVLVGIGTVLADDPRLTARVPRGRDPVRIVVDSKLRTPPTAKLLADSPRTIIATTDAAPLAREKALVRRGAEVWRLRAVRGRVDLGELAKRLGSDGITSVLAEGGGEIHASLFAFDVADTVLLYVAPIVVGGRDAPSWIGGRGTRLAAAHKLALEDVAPIGPDLRLTYRRR